MPLSFLTRRGSKKAAAKAAARNRDASTLKEQKADAKKQPAPLDGSETPKAQTPQAPSARRRVNSEALGAGADDVFLNLANDDGSQLKPRSRSKSTSVEPQQPQAPVEDQRSSSPLKYLHSLSQRTSRAPEGQRGSQNPGSTLQPGDRQDQASSVSSRTPTLRPSKGAANGESHTEASNKRLSSASYYTTPSPTRPAYRPSELAYTTPEAHEGISRGPRTAPPESKKQHWPHHSDDLESHASTAAQSGLWDELHDLRARMRKLESNSTRSRHYSTTTPTTTEHTSSFDRPKTGTTQTTTSASRRSSNNDHLSPIFPPRPQQSLAESSEPHPLLHSALRKARLVTSREVYTALDSSASDALQLAASARANAEPSDLTSIATADDPDRNPKRLQRKADNLCRSLTELAIVLCEQARATSSSGFPPRSPYDTAKPPPSALSGVNFSGHRPSSSGRVAASEYGTPSSGHHLHNGYNDSPSSHLESRRNLADRISRLQTRANARSVDSRTPAGRANSVVEASSSTWTPKHLNRAATTGVSTHSRFDMPEDPADLMDEDSAPSRSISNASNTRPNDPSSSSDSSDEEQDHTSALRATRTATEPPAPVANMARRAISPHKDSNNHSPRDLRLSKDYTQRHPLPEGLSPSIRKVLERGNGSSPSVASSRTARAGSVTGPSGIPRANGAGRSARSNSVPQDDREEVVSQSASGQAYTNGEERRGSKTESGEKDRDLDKSDSKSDRRSNGSARKDRLPPSTGAGLAERLEARRQQRLNATDGSTNGSYSRRA